jgi:hypothetical protein
MKYNPPLSLAACLTTPESLFATSVQASHDRITRIRCLAHHASKEKGLDKGDVKRALLRTPAVLDVLTLAAGINVIKRSGESEGNHRARIADAILELGSLLNA